MISISPDQHKSYSPETWRDLPIAVKHQMYARMNERIAIARGASDDYAIYADDPVGFGRQVLGEEYTDDVERMMLSVRDNEITLAKSANATGKTHGAARVAAWFYKAFPGAQVYTAAAPPESNLKNLLWGEVGSIVDRHPQVFKEDSIRSLHIAHSAKNFITGVTIPVSGTAAQREAKFSGKHAPHLLFILDEGDAIPDEVYRGIESCISGGHARLLIMFNPRAEAGEAYRLEREGRANVVHLSAMSHPNVVTGEDIIPGAVTREKTIKRINQWCRPLAPGEKPDSECFKLPDFLVGCQAEQKLGVLYPPLKPGYYKIVQSAFSYMVLGQYPAQGSDQLISREWIDRARSRWDSYVLEHGEVPPIGTSGIGGLDVAEFGDDDNVFCRRFGGFVPRLARWSGMDIAKTADRGVEECRKSPRVKSVNTDANGVGAGVAPVMRRQNVEAYPIKSQERATEKTELGEFNKLRDQLLWAVREWLRTDPGAMLPPDEPLLEELWTPTYEVINGRICVMKKDDMKELLKRSPDHMEALALTFAPQRRTFGGMDLEGVFV